MACRWQVEIDPYCRRVLARHWPDVTRYTDVREVGADELTWVDLVAGGFPCQDISYAGRGAGLAGAGSGLWYEFARVVRELGPRYVLVENVAALLRRGLDDVLGTLASLGYDAEWHCIPAASVGALHQLDRVFIIARFSGWRQMAHSNRLRCHQPYAREHMDQIGSGALGQRTEKAATTRDRRAAISAETSADASLADSGGERFQERNSVTKPIVAQELARALAARGCHWSPEPDVGRVADGVPSRVDRLRGLGNAVVPQVAEVIGRAIMAADARERADG